MEPLSIVAIAGAVMQVITFSKDMIDLYRNIKKNGSIDDDLEGKSAQIATNARLIQDNLANTSAGSLAEADTALHDVANKCLGCSKALRDAMNNIKWNWVKKKGSMTRKARGALGRAWKVQRYKSEIEKLEKDLKDVQETMKGTILAAVAEHDKGFDKLDSQIQQFIISQADHYRRISTNITDESAGIKQVILVQTEMLNNRIVGQTKTQIDREQRLLFLGSLQFSTMRERNSRVSMAHDKTFRWIFDKNISGPWDSFNAWLKSEEQVYWISGKPVSGKSTLMKYLIDHDTTIEILQEWDPAVSILSFFLWNPGDKLQKSVQAIMTSKRRVVMFLDGLDEIDRKAGPFPVIQLLKTLEIKTHAKLCLSSRPEAQFQDALGKRRTLRLEDLTGKDISEYVEDYFQEHLNFWGCAATESQAWRETITVEILMRASGVFLWVFLVLRSLRSGTSNLDSYDQLLHRVRQLPSSLEQLYRQAWERQGEDEQIYRHEAASYFNLVLLSQQMDNLSIFREIPLSLLEFLLAHDSHLRGGLLDSHVIPQAKVLISKAHVLQRHIETRSGGLLEVFRLADSTPGHENMERFIKLCFKDFLNQFLVPFSAFLSPGEGGSGASTSGRELAELSNISHTLSVGFIHRTAADFVSNTDWGNELMYGVQKSDQEIRTGLCEARLARILLYSVTSADPHEFLELFDSIRSVISQEQYIRLRSSLERVYTQLIDSSPKIVRLIDDLSTQILQGEFDSDCSKGKDKRVLPSFSGTGLRVIQDLPSLADLSRQILDNCRSGRPDPQSGCASASDLPLFPLPDTVLSPSTSMPRISAHIVFSAWVLADSRDLLRLRTVKLLGELSLAATIHGMSNCLQRYMDRWPHIYKTTKGFRKALMSSALSEGLEPRDWVGQNSCIRHLLSIGEDPIWSKPRMPPASVPLSHFEWFLLQVPQRCREEVLGIESSIIATINAFLAAGARLDSRTCVAAFGGLFPVPLRSLASHGVVDLPSKAEDQAVPYDLIAETDSMQLLDRGKGALKARAKKLQITLEGLDDLPDTDRAFESRIFGVLLRPEIGEEILDLSEPEDSKVSGRYFYAFQPEDMEIVAERFKFESSRSPDDWIEGGSNFTMKTRKDIASIMSKASKMSKGREVWDEWWQNESGYRTEHLDPVEDTILWGRPSKKRKAGSHLYEKWFPEWAKMTTSHAHINDEPEVTFMIYNSYE
ncbi:hypothetical protein V8F06_010052 [Rhypophila decipiens]